MGIFSVNFKIFFRGDGWLLRAIRRSALLNALHSSASLRNGLAPAATIPRRHFVPRNACYFQCVKNFPFRLRAVRHCEPSTPRSRHCESRRLEAIFAYAHGASALQISFSVFFRSFVKFIETWNCFPQNRNKFLFVAEVFLVAREMTDGVEFFQKRI